MGDYEKGWEYGSDTPENALISYQDGIETLLINLDIQTRDTGAVLVTPIPAQPQSVEADIQTETPVFTGFDIEERAKERITDIRTGLLSTQLYPLAGILLYSLFSLTFGEIGSVSSPDTLAIDSQITVYQHTEKEGMIAEVLSAATPEALYDYLKNKGLRVEKNSIPIFHDYIRDDFSFVAAWIDPAKEYGTARALTMRFPNEQIYYPLKPNSAYEGEGRDKTISVLGYVSPNIYEEIADSTIVTYNYSEEPLEFAGFQTGGKGFGFTNIRISADPQRMKEDIMMSDRAPLRIMNAHALSLHSGIYFLILLVIVSLIATHVGLRSTEVRIKKGAEPQLLLTTLFNCFTLIGTLLSLRTLQVGSKVRYVTLTSLSFVLATVAITQLLYVWYL